MADAYAPYKGKRSLAGQAYILQNQVTHVRFLPSLSKHSFVYPTLSVLVSLNALENGELDLLGGWLFSYGGVWGRLTGLRPSAYLFDRPTDKRSIKHKLMDLLDQHGLPGCTLQDAWLLTMPSFLGFEGINPLSVYFCYRHRSPTLWVVVLEVHNTFGERHVYVLETGQNEQTSTGKFDHQWRIPRQFHVSPFNDRSGHYICQLIAPLRPPSPLEDQDLPSPCPVMKITLLTSSPHVEKKLVAIQRTVQSTPLSNTTLLSALARAPLRLFLTFPLIAYNAYILHYQKSLNVYQRPEPCASDPNVELQLPAVPNAPQKDVDHPSRGVGWQKMGYLERWCEQCILAFLHSKCAELDVSVTFVPANPFEDKKTIRSPSADRVNDEHTLTIYYRSPKVFTIIFMMPSPIHALLYGVQGEKNFSVSSETLFNLVFAAPASVPAPNVWTHLAWRIRNGLVPKSLGIPVPPSHALDRSLTATSIFVLLLLSLLTMSQEKLFKAIGARFAPGEEPWGGWSRLHSDSQSYCARLEGVRHGEAGG